MMRLRSKSAALFLLPLMGCAGPRSSSCINDSVDRSPTGGEAYHGLIQYRAKDAKQAILEPTLLSASEVRAKRLATPLWNAA